jgi:hypothetical protein
MVSIAVFRGTVGKRHAARLFEVCSLALGGHSGPAVLYRIVAKRRELAGLLGMDGAKWPLKIPLEVATIWSRSRLNRR